MGGVTFYGESARVIRDAQAVLQAAGAGQLEVVKREPFQITLDGHVYISEAVVGKAAITPSQYGVKLDMKSGKCVVAGIGVGVQPEKPKVIIAQELLDEIQKQISESELGNELAKRVEDLEKSRSQILADAKREVAESILRDLDRDKCNATLGGLKQRFQGSDGPSFCGWPGASLAAGAVEPLIARVAQQPKPE